MTLHAWPLDSPDGVEPAYYGRRLRATTVAPYLAGARPGRPLGVHSGVRPGTPSTTVEASSTTWTLHPCAGVIDPHDAAVAGAYSWAVEDDITGELTAASGTYTRWDGVYVVIDDPAEGDGTTTPAIRVEYVAGTPTATPSLPSAPARSLRLARIVVPPSGAGAPTVVWDPPILAGAGSPIRVRSQTEADALVAIHAPSEQAPLWVEMIGGSTTGDLRRHDGTRWWTYPPSERAPDWQNVTLSSPFVVVGSTYATLSTALVGTSIQMRATTVGRSGGTQSVSATAQFLLSAAGSIPAAHRPATVQRTPGTIHLSSATPTLADIIVYPDGSIGVLSGATGTLAAYAPTGTSYVTFPHMTWPAA